MFVSLDFLYVPTADMDAAVRHYVDVLGGELVWRVRGMGTVVANVRLSGEGPAVLLSGHLDPPTPVLVYRVADYGAAIAALRAAGQDDITQLEIPHGPCASFPAPDGQRIAVYELARPEAAHWFDGRRDP